MAQANIGIGTTPDDGLGDPLRTAFGKANSNFTELYDLVGGGSKSPVIDCGNVDLSSGNMPTTGGTGAAGAIRKGNMFTVIEAGTVSGVFIDEGAEIKAQDNAPGNDLTKWRIYTL